MVSDYRIYEHPILDIKRGKRVTFFFEGKIVEAYEGESILASLYALGIRVFSWSYKLGRPRGAFCMIGKCSSCLGYINGIPNRRLCVEPVRDGIRVERQRGTPSLREVNHAEDGEVPVEELSTDLLIVGGGPAGLQAALKASDLGMSVTVVDEGLRLGGQLVKQTHKFFGIRKYYGGLRGFEIASRVSREVESRRNINVLLNSTAYGFFRGGIVGVAVRGDRPKNILVKPKAIIGATGAFERFLDFENNDLPGVMGAGAAQTLMNQYYVRPGDNALIVGSGNVGLLVAYQLLQADVKVKAVIEIRDEIGGWFVHAAKIRRLGVPIILNHTIVKALGRDVVEGAVIQMVKNYELVPETEKVLDVDLILLAVGLTPDTRIFEQAGCIMRWIPELGGLVPLRTKYLETSIRNLFIAGDASGIEEATTAFIEGEIAALSAAINLGFGGSREEREREELLDFLWNQYRKANVLKRARIGKLKATISEEEMRKLRRLL